jgi:hypothetical protein
MGPEPTKIPKQHSALQTILSQTVLHEAMHPNLCPASQQSRHHSNNRSGPRTKRQTVFLPFVVPGNSSAKIVRNCVQTEPRISFLHFLMSILCLALLTTLSCTPYYPHLVTSAQLQCENCMAWGTCSSHAITSHTCMLMAC